MASGIATTVQQDAEDQSRTRPDRNETFIEDRIQRTRREVMGLDLAAGLITLAAGVLAYLLAIAVVDHWLIPGGLGFAGRLLLFAGLIGAAGYYFARGIFPALAHRINPLFAAHTIEQGRPTLKNSLINFLLMRSRRREVSAVVYNALENRAAADLAQVPAETAVDRSVVIRLGYLLAAVLAVCCLYMVLSPKSPLASAARVLWPWAGIQAPTRVTIEEVKPGDVTAFHGEHVAVSAEVKGTEDDEQVTLVYSTADGQSVDQAVPMTLPESGYRYRCQLPPGRLGLRQDYEYYLTAGDCRTKTFAVKVQTAPTIRIDTLRYDYPDYTGIEDRTVQRQGDIRAIEGTKVTVHATADEKINRAEIDLDCDGLHGLRMSTEQNTAQNTATGGFVLRLDPDDPTFPEHDCYQIRFTDARGRPNYRPVRYRIEVIRDLPPEVQIIEPKDDEVQLAADGLLPIRVRAVDPDFALRLVRLRTELDGRRVPIRPLLGKQHKGEFRAEYIFEPARLGLNPGQRVCYWAEADDNKQPNPGHAETRRRWINIVEPDEGQKGEGGRGKGEEREEQKVEGQQGEEQQRIAAATTRRDSPQNGEEQKGEEQQGEEQQSLAAASTRRDSQQQGEGQQGEGQQGEGQQGEGQQSLAAAFTRRDSQQQGEEQQGEGQQGEEQHEHIDPDTQDGDAFEEILNHRREQQKANGQESGEQPTGEQQQGEEQKGEGGRGKGDGSEQQQQSLAAASTRRDSQQQGDGQQGKQQQEPGKSPSISPKQSDTQGDTAGDRSGEGEEGGGQQSPQAGKGTPGLHTQADRGGSQGKQQGEGQTGTRAGEQSETDRQTGSTAKQPGGDAGGGNRSSRPDDSPGGTPQQNPTDGGRPGRRTSDGPTARGSGSPTTGGRPGDQGDDGLQQPPTKEPGGENANLEYARKVTDLALEHLSDQMDKEDSELLERLGWTADEARRFLARWEQLKQTAGRSDEKGDEARRWLAEALKSLGLRGGGTELRGGGTRPDRLDSLRESGRFDPPPDWAEHIREFYRGRAAGR